MQKLTDETEAPVVITKKILPSIINKDGNRIIESAHVVFTVPYLREDETFLMAYAKTPEFSKEEHILFLSDVFYIPPISIGDAAVSVMSKYGLSLGVRSNIYHRGTFYTAQGQTGTVTIVFIDLGYNDFNNAIIASPGTKNDHRLVRVRQDQIYLMLKPDIATAIISNDLINWSKEPSSLMDNFKYND